MLDTVFPRDTDLYFLLIALPSKRYVTKGHLQRTVYRLIGTNYSQIRQLMDRPANIRNMSVIAHGEHFSVSVFRRCDINTILQSTMESQL